MLEKFSWIKVNSAGPDGIHPIITKLVKEQEKQKKLIDEALKYDKLFDTRVTLINKPKGGSRPIQITNVGARWFEKALLPYVTDIPMLSKTL